MSRSSTVLIRAVGAGALVREMIRVSARPSKVPNAPRTRGRAAIHGRVERD